MLYKNLEDIHEPFFSLLPSLFPPLLPSPLPNNTTFLHPPPSFLFPNHTSSSQSHYPIFTSPRSRKEPRFRFPILVHNPIFYLPSYPPLLSSLSSTLHLTVYPLHYALHTLTPPREKPNLHYQQESIYSPPPLLSSFVVINPPPSRATLGTFSGKRMNRVTYEQKD